MAGDSAVSSRRWNRRHGNLPRRKSAFHDYRSDGKLYVRSETSRRPEKRDRTKVGNAYGKFPAAAAFREARREMAAYDPSFLAKRFLTPRHYFLLLLPKPIDSQPHHISRPQIHRRLLSEPDSRRRARRNNVARLQTHEPAQITHQMRHAENHRLRRSVLITLSIHFQPQMQILRIRNFVVRHEPRPNRPKRVGTLSLHPLPRAFQLKRALRQIIHHAVSRHV